MDSLAERQNLPAIAKQIVMTDDPYEMAQALRLLEMDDDALLETYNAVESFVSNAQAEFDKKLAQDRRLMQIWEAVAKHRIASRGGKMLLSDTCQYGKLTAPGKPDKRFEVLVKLFEMVPPQRLKDALWVDGVNIKKVEPEAIAAIIEAGAVPTYNGHITKLRKLAEDLGGEVAAVVKEGIVEGDPRSYFAFERIPQSTKPLLKAVR